MINIHNNYEDIKSYYDEVLNIDKSTFKSSNDEPTPIGCIEEMMSKIPDEFWDRNDLKILDPCCGNGNFFIPIYQKLRLKYTSKEILENMLYFNDINEKRLENVKHIYCESEFVLNISNDDFLVKDNNSKFDLVVANPPYAKLLADGKRASKNHNLIKDFIEKSLKMLKPNGYIMFITPDNWMSYADRNQIISLITELQIVHLDIHSAKKYFKKIGSSFTWYIIQNCPAYKDISVSGIWKGQEYFDNHIKSGVRKYIPLLYNSTVQSILAKTVDSDCEKFIVQTSSDLHHYTKKTFISSSFTEEFKYRLIHTPKQTVYANRPHKFQEGFKVFISTTDKYKVFVDNCGMTQSICFIRCESEEKANQIKTILELPLYKFLNNICRYGNFNNIRILQSLPFTNETSYDELLLKFSITDEEKKFIEDNL